MVWIFVILFAVGAGFALRWGAKKADDADEALRSMASDGRPRMGIFGVLKKNRQR